MEKLIAAFPQNILDALKTSKELKFQNPKNEIQNIVFVGMGGSGIGAKIISQWIQDEVNIPVLVFQDYTLPKFVNKNTLFIACSYSGNTEETLTTVEKAKETGAHIIGLTSGGGLKNFCDINDYDCVLIEGGNPPRSAMAFSLVHILNILTELKLISTAKLDEIEAAKNLLDSNIDFIKSEAKKISSFLYKKSGIFYSISDYEPILIRARQQFNENSKILCSHQVIPEMNHNELVGWAGGSNDFAVIFFDTKDLSKQNRKRFDITIDVVKRHTSNVMMVDALGENAIERSIYLIHLVDWASLYLSEMNEVDIMDIKSIEYLKSELSKI
jgi:glucose/mannose-6-phosphate isomerase